MDLLSLRTSSEYGLDTPDMSAEGTEDQGKPDRSVNGAEQQVKLKETDR